MIFDITDCFTSVAGVLTPQAPGAVGTNLSASYIDRLAKMDDGAGADIIFHVLITTAMLASGGAAEIDFQLLGHATDPTFASGNTVLASTGPIAKATLIAGHHFDLKVKRLDSDSLLPKTAFLRYLTAAAVVTTHDITTGAYEAWINNDGVQDNFSYPAGYTV